MYVARWTAYHVRQLTKSMVAAMGKKGFSFVEIIAPCPTLYERRNRLGTALERMLWYKENVKIKNGADTRECDIEFQKPFVCGEFVNVDRPSLVDLMAAKREEVLGQL